MKNVILPAIHLAAIVLPVPGFPANIICTFDISCSALNFYLPFYQRLLSLKER